MHTPLLVGLFIIASRLLFSSFHGVLERPREVFEEPLRANTFGEQLWRFFKTTASMADSRSLAQVDYGGGPSTISFAAKRRMFGADGAFGNGGVSSPLPNAMRALDGNMGTSVTSAPRFAQGTKFAVPGAMLARSTYPFPATIPPAINRNTLKRNWAFSVGKTSNGRTNVVHIELLNQILREDWEAFLNYFDNLSQQRNDADEAPNAVGLGRKRRMVNLSGIDGEETPGGDVDDANGPISPSGFGLYDMKNVAKYVRFLGYVDPSDEATSDHYRGYNGSLENLPITHAGLVHEVINIFGENIGVGDKLSFYVGRVNALNKYSMVRSLREFGPIQVIPISSKSKTASYASVGKLDLFWARYINRAYSLEDRRVLVEDIQNQNPLVARIGANEDVFCAANPPRSIAQGETPCDAVYYEPLIQSFEYTNADGSTSKSVLISPRVQDCMVFPIGMVHFSPRVTIQGLNKETRAMILNDPSGDVSGSPVIATTVLDVALHLVR